MPTINWDQRVADVLSDQNKPGRRLSPEKARLIMDDVVISGLTRDQIAKKHNVKNDWVGRTTVSNATRAIHKTGQVPSLAEGGWYETNEDQTYSVAPGFAAAWKKARGLS